MRRTPFGWGPPLSKSYTRRGLIMHMRVHQKENNSSVVYLAGPAWVWKYVMVLTKLPGKIYSVAGEKLG